MKIEKKYNRILYTICLSIVSTMFFLANPQNLYFDYGSGNGRFADRGDSFSEYIVRNTIKKNILQPDTPGLLPIITKGYRNEDYNYYPENFENYRSNLSFQIIPATFLAKIIGLKTEKELDNYLEFLRGINALLFSYFIVSIIFLFCRKYNYKASFTIPFLIGGLHGFVYFSQNLYFASALLLLPAFYISAQLAKQKEKQQFNGYVTYIFGCLYFLRGFEFSTIYALITAFTATLFTDGDLKQKLNSGLKAFSIICVSFISSLIIQATVIAFHDQLPIQESISSILHKVKHRNLSISDVPAPFSQAFFETMKWRGNLSAFSLTDNTPALSQFNIMILMAISFFIRIKKISFNEFLIYFYAFFGYASWYIFAYQHIMWHNMYDWYIFSLTFGISFCMLCIQYINLFFDYIKKYQNP